MDYGYIKLHRKIQDKGYYTKPNYIQLWIHLLLSANHKEIEFLWNGKIEKLKAGQLLTGRNKLSEELKISSSTIERILNFLENEHQIGQQKTTKFRIITIKNWEKYQGNNKKWTANRTTSGQQVDTYKNDKNDKNLDISKDISKERELSPFEEMKLFLEDKEYFNKVCEYLTDKKGLPQDFVLKEIKKFISYWSELTKSGKKQRWQLEKTFQLNRRLGTWFSNCEKFNGKKSNKVGVAIPK